MKTNEQALIERFNSAASVILDNAFLVAWAIDESEPLQLGPECQIVRLEWTDEDGNACSTAIDRQGVASGNFLPGNIFVSTDTEGTGFHLQFTPKTSTPHTLDDFLFDQPLYTHTPFGPELLELDVASVLGQRLAYILDPSRIYACSEDEWPKLALQAVRSAHAVLAKANPVEKRTPFDYGCTLGDQIPRSLIEDFKRLLDCVEEASTNYAVSPFNGPDDEALRQRLHAAKSDLIALFTTTINRRPPVGWESAQ